MAAIQALTFDVWWKALAAVPRSKGSRDWWAPQSHRATPYDRLKRVWFDHTRFDSKGNRHRFYDSSCEDHLTVTLWENFALFHPADWLPSLMTAAGLAPLEGISDCCWSYEYEAVVDRKFRQSDVTLHVRDAAGDAVVVIEAKKPGGTLKATDTDPSYYLDIADFSFTDRRYLIYVVDVADRTRVASALPPSRGRHGIIDWQFLAQLQLQASRSLDVPEATQLFIRDALGRQVRLHGIDPAGLTTTFSIDAAALVEATRMHLDQELPPQVRGFIASSTQHQLCCTGTWQGEVPFPYLREEPPLARITAAAPGKQTTEERRLKLWQLD